MRVDVLIVGAGPAGSTTARFCAGKDLDVLMIDRRKEIGYPVQCGELLPHTKEMYSIFPRSADLDELFTIDGSLVAGESDHIDLVSPRNRTYRCDFKSHVLDRRSFDKHLAKLAVEAGARLETGASFMSLKDGVAVTSLGAVKAKVIVGADGPNSRTARQAGLSNPAVRYPAITCQAKGDFEPDVKMFFGGVAPGGYAWIIPKARGANVGVGYSPAMLSGTPRAAFDSFIRRLGCEYTDLTMGLVPISGPVPSTVAGNVLLVGDAAGHVMATNGGGIPTAMIAGRIAGRTIRSHLKGEAGLDEYESGWRAVMGGPLKTSLKTRRLADMVFSRDCTLELAMRMLGRRGLDRAIRCKRAFL